MNSARRPAKRRAFLGKQYPSVARATIKPTQIGACPQPTAPGGLEYIGQTLSALTAQGHRPSSVDVTQDGTIRFHFHPSANSNHADPTEAAGAEPLRSIANQYRESSSFRDLALSTQREWARWLDRIDETLGDIPIEKFRSGERIRPVIRQWRNVFAKTPRSADYGMQVLSRLLSFAIDPLGKLDSNPCGGIKKLYKADRADIVWSDSDIAAFKAVASPEVGQAVDLAVTTGLRLEDLLGLRWSSVSCDAILVATGKSRRKREALIPRYNALNLVLDGIPARGPTVLTNSRKQAWTKSGFESSFYKAKQRAGLAARDLHFHDLRGTAATRFYAAGLSERVIGEILAWEETQVSRIIRRYVTRTAATRTVIEQLNRLY